MLKDLVLGDDMLTLSINEGAATGFDYFWLRDNARDPESFDSRSHQRELYTAAVDPTIRPKAARLSDCLLYTSPSPRDRSISRMPSSA